MVEGTLDYMGAEALPAIFLLRCLSHVRVGSHLSESNMSKKGDQNNAYLQHTPQKCVDVLSQISFVLVKSE